MESLDPLDYKETREHLVTQAYLAVLAQKAIKESKVKVSKALKARKV